MAKNVFFFFLLVLVVAIATTTTTGVVVVGLPDDSTPTPMPPMPTVPTAYEMLGQYGFPVGILPEGAQGYELRPDGSFEVHLPADCDFRIMKEYTLHYSSRVAGSIQNGTITALEGVKVKIVFAWVGIRQVDRDGDDITLHVGSMSKSFPLDKFSVSPQCN